MDKRLYDDLNRISQEQLLGKKDVNLSVDIGNKVFGDRIIFYHYKNGTCKMFQLYGLFKKKNIGIFHFYENEIISNVNNK